MNLAALEKDKNSKTNNIIVFDYLQYVFIKDKKLITEEHHVEKETKKKEKSRNLSN